MTIAFVNNTSNDTFVNDLPNGVSPTANNLRKQISEISYNLYENTVSFATRQEKIIRELSAIFIECSKDDWDGYHAKPVDPQAMNAALRFLQVLPLFIPLPELSADPDGEVTLEWNAGPRHTLYMSIGANGVINYAGLYGLSKSKGIEYFSDEVPNQILRCIKRVCR